MDGGLADNLAVRGVLESLAELEVVYDAYRPTWLDQVHRIIVLVVNSVSSPKTKWNKSERAPGDVAILVKATGVAIDHFSY